MSRSSYFVSDLHMFSRRSRSLWHERDIFRAAADAHTFVLGGDIFDFRWSTLPTVSATVDEAIGWLSHLVLGNGHCNFHFVLGNHDSHHLFIRELSSLADRTRNLAWHHYYVRLGPSMFLHGDVADRRMDQHTLARRRSRWHHDRPRSEMRHKLYDTVVHLRLHRLASSCVYRKRSVARRILVYLEDIGHGPQSGLRNVYFGHTHSPLEDFEYGGLKFHNGGAPIKGLDFRIVETDISD